ncbi:MAG: aminotransferase class I/II-fold pyridoxal phosphate-dependent enzyme, partial [Verrucomicrobiota bacterium]
FRSCRPTLEFIDKHTFKYHIDFDRLAGSDDVAAICVSRPTNPTGNVLTDGEIARLSDLARSRSIPLIIDNAYGAPFPNVIFEPVTPVWDEHIILTLSLSKLGLPGTRTGIVIAHEEIIDAVASMTAVVGLANNNVGQTLARPLLESGEMLRISREHIQPFYRTKSRQAIEWVHEAFDDDLPYYVHKSEGAIFLWLWFKDLPGTTHDLYERLKARGVLIVPGSYFFFGMPEDWRQKHECIRMTFTQSESSVRRGIEVIAEEVKKMYLSS